MKTIKRQQLEKIVEGVLNRLSPNILEQINEAYSSAGWTLDDIISTLEDTFLPKLSDEEEKKWMERIISSLREIYQELEGAARTEYDDHFYESKKNKMNKSS